MKRQHKATRHIPCSVEGCEKPHEALGYCQMHRLRFRRNGSPTLQVKPSIRERIESSIRLDDSGCWIWVKAHSVGYGNISIKHVTKKAHRVSYEAFVGPIPEGMVIDHLCRVTMCVNPSHLEPVTQQINVRRGNEARGVSRL